MEVCVKNEFVWKVLSAIFYGFSSFSIMIINKSVLTHYHFPSFQALSIGGTKTLKTSFAFYAVDHIQVFNLLKFQLGQMLATILLLYSGKMLGKISIPSLTSETFPKVWPLPLFYLGNLVFGLGSTQVLSLPMMTVLRRFSILMTLIGMIGCSI